MFGFLTVNTGAELICFIIALVTLTRDTSDIWRLMIVFLFITCLTEILGFHFKKMYLADRQHVRPNIWLYNILLFFQYSFFCLVFNYLLKKYIHVQRYIITTFIVLTIVYVFGLVKNGVFNYNELTNTVM